MVRHTMGVRGISIPEKVAHVKEIPKEAEEATPTAVKEIRIWADQLFAEFEANAVAAGLKYNTKVLIVSGIIESIKPALLDESLVVALCGTSQFQTVDCSFSKSNASQLAKLNRGHQVTIRGTYEGKAWISVTLTGCDIVKK